LLDGFAPDEPAYSDGLQLPNELMQPRENVAFDGGSDLEIAASPNPLTIAIDGGRVWPRVGGPKKHLEELGDRGVVVLPVAKEFAEWLL
jgi:hypothetical protein